MRPRISDRIEPKEQQDEREHGRNCNRGTLEPAGVSVTVTGSPPGGQGKISGEDSDGRGLPLPFHCGEREAAGGHCQYGAEEQCSGAGMAERAFAERECRSSGEQRGAAGEDVEDENDLEHAYPARSSAS